jgi:hypothetical protein
MRSESTADQLDGSAMLNTLSTAMSFAQAQ